MSRQCKHSASVNKIALVRSSVLAFALSVGLAVGATPGLALAKPGDSGSSGSSSNSSASSPSDSRQRTSARDSRRTVRGSERSASSSGSVRSGNLQRSADSQRDSDSPRRHARTSERSSEGAQSSETAGRPAKRSRFDKPSSVEAEPSQPDVPTAVVRAAPEQRPAAQASPPRGASASGAATNSVGHTPPVGSANPQTADRQATESVRTAAEAADVATEPRRGPTALAESVTPDPAVNPVVAADVTSGLEPATVPVAASDTPAPMPADLMPSSDAPASSDRLSGVVSRVLTGMGLNPRGFDNQGGPVQSPAMWAVLAWARRRTDEQQPSNFGRLFPVAKNPEATMTLEPLNQQTDQQLVDLAQTMLGEGPTENPKGTTAGITYFGQFIDHDLTLDTEPSPTDTVDVDGLVNGRTFAFDLDSVYGGGPKESPELYDGDKFMIGTATDGVSPDLPRNADGSAIIAEARNDENLIISQIHLSFLRLHNALVDEGLSFNRAQQTVVDAYRDVVLNDYLPQIVGQDAVDQALSQPVSDGYYVPGAKDSPITPAEFSVAAFRFGHSQVRNGYAINDTNGALVFSLDPDVPDLRGGRQLPADLVIDFNNFFSELPRGDDENPAQIGEAIDTKISESLFNLPIPGVAGGGSNVLAYRNLVRGKFYDMPSGEAIASAMDLEIVGEPVFPEGTPLWYYVLREAELSSGGAELGPVGGSIVAEVFVDLLRLDGATKDGANKDVRGPSLPDVSGDDFLIGDLLVAADQLEAGEPGAQAPKPRRGDEARQLRGHSHDRAERDGHHRHRRGVDLADKLSARHLLLRAAS